MKKKIFSVLSALLILALCAGCGAHEVKIEPVSVDLSSFEAQTLDGGTFTQADFVGKDVTAINFWGTYCTPCIEEMPELGKLAKELPDNVQLISVCTDGAAAPEDAKQIINQTGFDVPTLISGDETFQGLLEQIQAVPTTVFVDERGKLIGNGLPFGFGGVDDDTLEKAEMGIITGGGKGMRTSYVKAFHKALKTVGKPEIALE